MHPRSLHIDGVSIINAEPKKLPGPSFLHELVSLASNDGLPPAVDFLSQDGQRTVLSYSELHTASLTLAHKISHLLRSASSLSSFTLEDQDHLVIPILSPQSPQLYVAILAALKVGGAFCPLNADAPPDRVRFILEDVKAKIVLVSRDLASKLPLGDGVQSIIIDGVLDFPEIKGDVPASHHEPKPEDLAYVMYTSGSTGTPKGVAVSHLAATQSILAHESHIPPFSRFLQFAAPTFDVSVFEIFFPLFRGATLVGCNRADMLTDLAGVLRKMQVDACELTPSVAGSLLRQRSRVPNLRLLLTIGEMLTEQVIREFGGDENKTSILWGMYGPTEAAIHCTFQAAFPVASERGTIGIPFDTVSAYIIRLSTNTSVASQFDVLPVGEVGELALGGFQLATCYLNRPEQTATSFLETPWGRVYRTGDKAKMRLDGTIECLGRIEEGQVKLNGQRLELGEIEQALLRAPGCHSAVAAVISNTLVAFAAVEQISRSEHTTLDSMSVLLPQLSSGKIDRKRLINDYMTRTAITAGNEEASDENERLLCEIATTILGERVGPLTELLAAKLDSLAAIEFASTLRELGLSITPIDILSTKTLRELRGRIENFGTPVTIPALEHPPARCQSPGASLESAKLESVLGDQIHEIDRLERSTPLQQSMIAETLKNGNLYINQVEFEVASSISHDILQSSIRTLVDCNEILRTGFTFVEDQLFQVIWKQLDESQLYEDADGNSFEVETRDVDLFLLRPLKIQIRRSSSEPKHFRLFLTLHHAIYDGWTVDLMIEDLSLLLSGKLPTKRPQFSQIMEHLHHSPEIDSIDSMEFWTEHLRGIGAATTPKFRTEAISKPQLIVSTTKILLDPRRLKDLMSDVSVGPQVLFQACLVWLWTKVCGVEDIVIGCVSSGRSLPLADIDKLMGPCMVTLPLRVNISRYRTVIELLQSIHSINRETLRHGHVPLSKIHKVAGLSSSSKLFDVIFAYQESLASRRETSNIVRETGHCDATEAKLVVEIKPCGDHFICQTTSQTDIISQPLAKTFASHLGCLVDYFNSNVGAPLEATPQCFPSKSLSYFNDTPRSIKTYSSLPEMVEHSTSRFPSAAALCFATSIAPSDMESQSLSYHDLNSKANQIARHLQKLDPGHGGVVAIIMEKSPLLYCSILGILKTGCAYLPILPSTPPERVNTILNQAEPRLCVVDSMSSSIFVGRESPRVVNMEVAILSSYSSTNLALPGKPSDLAYVIYTSGTTGIPKGVAVTNKNILSNISVLSDIYPHEPSSRMLQACSQAFDVSVFEIFFAWANNMCLCAATNDTLFQDFEFSVRALGITHLSPTVTVASLLDPGNVPNVKFLVTSGEPMTDEVLDRWSQHLYQGYGPSETTNICTVRKVSKGDSSQFLGWSFENTSTFVMSPGSTDLVPVGCVGELCFGGDQVAAGYLKLPDATAVRFIDHPDYGRLYRSGDLGRMLPDGSLIIHGRIDTQVKLRGLRIELQEIEALALRSGHTRTCKSVLVTHEDAKLQHLSLFYVPPAYDSAGFQLLPLIDLYREQAQTLRHVFQSSLPDYMVPTFIFPISSLPLTPSGKVDEGALRSSVKELSAGALNDYSSTNDEVDVHKEWSETEALIAEAIIDLLGKDRNEIKRWTSFSALGIDSISAMPIARKLQRILRKRVPLSLLLQNPNVNRLASAIDKIEASRETAFYSSPLLPEELVEVMHKRFAAKGVPIAKVLPCTPLQEAMIMSSLSPSPTASDNVVAYYNQMLFHLRIPYEVIIPLWDDIVRRHEILRALFVTSDNMRYPAVQIILDGYAPEWSILEVGNGSLSEQASRHLASMSTAIDCDKPPMALAIIRTKDRGDYLSFVCHHAMYDGISMQIMLSEIEALYHGRQLPEPTSLEPFLREIKSSHPNQDIFWKRLFHGFQPVPLQSSDFSRDAMSTSMSAKASRTSLKLIESQLQDMGVSMLALVQTAWAITLSMLSQRRDVSLGSVVTGRSISLDLVDNLVAPCFNTLPVRMDLSLSVFLIDVMKSLQSINAELMLHQFASLRRIQKEIGVQTRLFDTLVILQPPTTPLDSELWSLIHDDGLMDIPIVCEIIPSGLEDTLTIQLHRDKSKFPYESLRLMSNIFSHILDACLKYPSSHIPTRDALPADLQKDILRIFHNQKRYKASNRIPSQTPDIEEIWSPLEVTIRQTLARLAETPEDQIERLTPIYRYGLDSITAIQLATLLRLQNISISATDVLAQPTCAGIAAAVKDFVEEDFTEVHNFGSFQQQVEAEIVGCGVDLNTVEVVLPCTATQQGLLSQFLDSEGRYYFNYSSWALDMSANSDHVAWAWSQLSNYHQILRCGFIPVNHPDSSFAMVAYRVNNFTPPIAKYQSDTFDIEQWLSDSRDDALNALVRPPWRLALVTSRTADGEASLTIHLAMHHALYDAFTLRSLLQDLSQLISHGNEPKVTNIDYALSHHLNLVRSSQSAGEAFWKRKADEFVSHKFPVMTPLQIDGFSSSVVVRTCEISSSLLRQAASEAGITVQAALQAAWTRLLSAYIGESHVTFGIVLDGRTTDLARKSTLPMIATLPVIAENMSSNSELLRQMMLYNSELRRSQFIPMAQIQRCLGATGSLFDTILIYQAADRAMDPLPFRTIKELALVEYPISLEIEELSLNTTQLNLVFRDSVLPQEQAMLLLNQFEAILTDLLLPAKNTASHLSVKTPEIFSIIPPIHKTLPIEADLLHELLENSAQLIPLATALEFIDDVAHFNKARRWTYQELDALGNQVAHFITLQSVSPGGIIATCFNKCPIAYFTLLGILKAGCGFLCLDPSAPAARQTFILEDSNAAMLLLNKSFDWAGEVSLPVHTVNENTVGSFPTSCPSLERNILPSDTCYCLYTSGTTGTPKGCLISHENAVQAMAAFKYLFTGRWNPNSRWLQFAAFHFDVSVLEQYWSWYVGIVVVAAPKDVILSDLAMTISTLGITHIDLTPSLARLINPEECPSLCEGVFITGGEKLRSDILDTWGPQRVIHNAYGPTEATIGVTMYRGVPQNGRPSNIGNLFPNVGAYIFERGSETPVLRGGVGELCVSGKLVGKGYLNRDVLTRERFPILQASGERIYRTGDLVRVLHDDSIDFLGRADDQVKLRGQRLEIGEINYAIRDGLADKAGDVATMVARRKAQDIDLLVSFVAPSKSNSAPELQIYYDATHIEFARRAQEACRSRLATYMVPSFIICVSRIPLSTNNKVDVNQLKKLFSELSHEQLQTLSTASLSSHRELNKLESQVLEAIYQVVRVKEDDVSPTTTVFQLGIDSITATRLAKQLRTMGFTSATPSIILRHPQISQLSQALHQQNPNMPSSNVLQAKQSIIALRHRHMGLVCRSLEVDSNDVEYIAPCTPLQQGIIARSKAREAHSAYFNQFRLCLDANVSIGRLKDALNRVIASYSILRTAFIDTIDGFLQVAIRNRPLRWLEVEADTESFEQMITERQRDWVAANDRILNRPVEVDHIQVSGQHYLLLKLFHGVYDARSLDIILENLEAEYNGRPWSSGPDFISVLPQGPLLGHQESHQFWKSLLKDHRFQPMPSLIDKPSAENSLKDRYLQVEGLEDRRKGLQVTHQTIMQAAWLHTLHQYFVDPPTIGVILSGRSLAFDDIDIVVGPLFNTLPLRVDLDSDASWASITQEIQKRNNGILTFVHTPLRDIQKLCTNGQPLFDTLFTFDHNNKTADNGEQAPWSVQDTPSHPDYPVAIEIILIGDNTLHVTISAQGSIADEPALESLLGQFAESLNSIVSPGRGVPLLPFQMANPAISKHASIGITELSSPKTSDTVTPMNEFSWDEKSSDIRRELAVLAKVDERDISETTNLFALGLDSIDVIKLSGRLAKLGYHVSMGALMKQPTLESIIISLEKTLPLTGDTSDSEAPGSDASALEDWYRRTGLEFPDVEAILPPTPLQDSMVAEMLRSDFHTYFNHDVLELPEDINIDHLKSALSEVYASSPILRTVFVEVDDPKVNSAYCQVVRKRELEFAPTSKISNNKDITTLTDLARRRAVDSKGTSDLFQVNLVETETGKLIILSVAHALYDGWSLNMLHQDIQAAYEHKYIPRQPYKNYLSRMILRSNYQSRQFWADLLHGARATLLPKVDATPGPGSFHRLEVKSKRSAADIRALCKDLRVTPQVFGQACWAAVLASLTKSLDVVFGVVLSGRDTEEAQGLMFPTMNTVPLRLALHGTVAEYLGYSQDIMSSVVEFQHTPLRDIQRFSRSHGDALFNTIFILQNSGSNEADRGSFLTSTQSVSAVDYPLCAELELTGEDGIWRIACDKNYMESLGVNTLGTSLERVLDYFAQNGNEQVLRFSPHNTQMVSICGLEPVVFSADLQEREDDLVTKEHTLQHVGSLPPGYEILLEVLSDLTKVDRGEIDFNLSVFHVGLDSISAIKASSMLRKRGLEISTRDLVTISTIREILEKANQAIDKDDKHPPSSSLHLNSTIDTAEVNTLVQTAGLSADSIETILPALPMQVHMLSVWQNSSGATFFPKFTFKVSGSVDLITISKTWAILVDEITMLRTHLINTNSFRTPFLQVILNSKSAREHAKSVLTEHESQWEFVYAATPFAVVQFLGEEPGEASLNLYIHHALYDGVSLPIVLNRFTKLCSSTTAGDASPQGASWCEFALKHLDSPIQVQRESFWKSYLSGNPVVQRYQLYQSSAATPGQRVNEFQRNAINNIAKLRLARSTHGVSTQALLFAAYSKAFVKWLRQDEHPSDGIDCIFGVYLANRSGYPGIEDAPFPTLNILPLRVKDPLSRSIAILAADIQKDITEISRFENSTASLWEIERWTGVRINTFVNILSVPGDTPLPESNSVILKKTGSDEPLPTKGTDTSTYLIASDSKSLAPNPVAHFYPEGVDIELALHEDVLDLGIFGSSSVVSATQVSEMVKSILAEIEAL
ncbi:hypothetical protein NUW58_g862 [Xylaria curta]|uniref:Uncharacterized protein n=1 Tax=Xylaria curta TaxID=42375 RepID=A0ACC1PP16_9PEZI|nr:hypothetical protein NUW58_g862 [Xylaria curta]